MGERRGEQQLAEDPDHEDPDPEVERGGAAQIDTLQLAKMSPIPSSPPFSFFFLGSRVGAVSGSRVGAVSAGLSHAL
eukprot:351736-Rhodomonas_salina.1